MEATLFDAEPQSEPELGDIAPIKGYMLAFDASEPFRSLRPEMKCEPEWELDDESFCETLEAAKQYLRDWINDRSIILAVEIRPVEIVGMTQEHAER